MNNKPVDNELREIIESCSMIINSDLVADELLPRLLQWGTRQRLDEAQTALNMTKQAYHTKTAQVHINQVSESVFVASNQYLLLRTESLLASLKDGGNE